MTHRTTDRTAGPADRPAAHRMTFRGTTVTAEPGQSVAAALVAAGILDWRTTRKEGRPRGLFCGIGVCFDCLISVDGAPAERACLVPAADGMRLGDDPRLAPTPPAGSGSPSGEAANPEAGADANSRATEPGPEDEEDADGTGA